MFALEKVYSFFLSGMFKLIIRHNKLHNIIYASLVVILTV